MYCEFMRRLAIRELASSYLGRGFVPHSVDIDIALGFVFDRNCKRGGSVILFEGRHNW